MNKSQARETLIKLWLEKAEDALASAELELKADHTNFAVNRLYYACFYAVTALLLKDGKEFARHSSVKSEFVRTYIKCGTIETKWNNFYQELFDDRQSGDYIPTTGFDAEDILVRLEQSRDFVNILCKLVIGS